ncbi:MAG: hypothetical protein KDN05_14725 [Verrucomicrobiae bacterium]|nr:hypothetical protein [Verrucomicrobiae bacterium]
MLSEHERLQAGAVAGDERSRKKVDQLLKAIDSRSAELQSNRDELTDDERVTLEQCRKMVAAAKNDETLRSTEPEQVLPDE